MSRLQKFKSIIFTALFLTSNNLHAGAYYHFVGWLNAFVPGSGEILLGSPHLGVLEAASEIGTFYAGYKLSKKSPMTLDGVPEDIPQFNRKRSRSQVSIARPLFADWLQEFGIKEHFVNTYNVYRSAAKSDGGSSGIDQTSTNDLFLAPFKPAILKDPWVLIPLGLIAAYSTYDYLATLHDGVDRVPIFTPASNYLYSLTNLGIFPVGSAAPEEMFFHGFLQNEFYQLISTPFFSIPLTSVLFAFAHEPGDGRYTAAISGAYMGLLAHMNQGKLSPGIALHFWSVLILGIEEVLLMHKAQHSLPPTGFSIQITY